MAPKSINPHDYMTADEAAAAIGCSRRAVYRAIARAGKAKVTVSLFGRSLVKKTALEEIRRHYYPHDSEGRKAMARKWGAAGGKQKAANASKSRA